MTYEFGVGIHSDILLYTNKLINLGYDYVAELPVMLWLANLQISHKNLFENFEEIEINGKSAEIDELVTKAKTIADLLPLNEAEFNKRISSKHLSDFSNGEHSILYEFNVIENLLILEATKRDDETNTPFNLLTLNATSIEELAKEYLKFASSNAKLGKYQTLVPTIYNQLKEYKI